MLQCHDTGKSSHYYKILELFILNFWIFFFSRDPKHFPQPDQHIPERWLKQNEVEQFKDLKLTAENIKNLIEKTESIHPYILKPFGHGTRMCAGRRYDKN